jgi:hypothetical protein
MSLPAERLRASPVKNAAARERRTRPKWYAPSLATTSSSALAARGSGIGGGAALNPPQLRDAGGDNSLSQVEFCAFHHDAPKRSA